MILSLRASCQISLPSKQERDQCSFQNRGRWVVPVSKRMTRYKPAADQISVVSLEAILAIILAVVVALLADHQSLLTDLANSLIVGTSPSRASVRTRPMCPINEAAWFPEDALCGAVNLSAACQAAFRHLKRERATGASSCRLLDTMAWTLHMVVNVDPRVCLFKSRSLPGIHLQLLLRTNGERAIVCLRTRYLMFQRCGRVQAVNIPPSEELEGPRTYRSGRQSRALLAIHALIRA